MLMAEYDIESFAEAPEEIFEDPLEQRYTCYKCKIEYGITLHEPLMGKNRQLSIKYKLQVPLCWKCHDEVQREPSQEYNRMLQVIMQRKFILYYPELDFLTIFGRNYL